MTVLDVGCGRGSESDPVDYRRALKTLKGSCREVIGIDVDPAAASNPGLDRFKLIEEGRWPIADQSVDVVVSDFVLEHVEDPSTYFSEVARVLRPGGVFCARTSNAIGYVGLAARLIPNDRHIGMLRHVQKSRATADVFPTRYRVNTTRALRRALDGAGLEGVVYGYEAEPAYLQFSAATYWFGRLLHLLTPPGLRTTLFAFARNTGRVSTSKERV